MLLLTSSEFLLLPQRKNRSETFHVTELLCLRGSLMLEFPTKRRSPLLETAEFLITTLFLL